MGHVVDEIEVFCIAYSYIVYLYPSITGLDSYFEYLLKAYILFGEQTYLLAVFHRSSFVVYSF